MNTKNSSKKTKTKQIKNDSTFKLPVYNKESKTVGHHTLPREIFGEKPNEALVSQAVRVYTDRQHSNLSSAKTRSQVSGGGRKPWRQKGTGRARAGTIRSPLWRGGGVVFGPIPSDSKLTLPKKMRQKALLSVLSAKLIDNSITLIDKIPFKEPKTKKALEILNKLPIENKRNILMILNDEGEMVIKSFRNIENADTINSVDLNTLDVLKSSSLIFTLGSIKVLEERLKNGNKQSD